MDFPKLKTPFSKKRIHESVKGFPAPGFQTVGPSVLLKSREQNLKLWFFEGIFLWRVHISETLFYAMYTY